MERLKATPGSQARKIEFIEAAMGEGAHLRLPPKVGSGPTSIKRWNEVVDIGLLYNFGPEINGSILAAMYKVSRQAIWQTTNRFLLGLHKNSSEETKKKFPLKTIVFKKPVILLQRENFSKIRGFGLAQKVKNLMEKEGLTSPAEIASRSGITLGGLRQISQSGMFKEWGLNLKMGEVRDHTSVKEVKDKVNQLTSDRELQEYLDGFSYGSMYNIFIQKDGTQDLFGRIGKTLREMGITEKVYIQPVALKLKAMGIPMRLMTSGPHKREGHEYRGTACVYFEKHKQRVVEAIKAMGPLNKNPEIMSLRNAKKLNQNPR